MHRFGDLEKKSGSDRKFTRKRHARMHVNLRASEYTKHVRYLFPFENFGTLLTNINSIEH